MKVYIAASTERQDEAVALAKLLQELGFEITSQWVFKDVTPSPINKDVAYFRREALRDLADVLVSDILIRISDNSLMGFPLIPSRFASGSRLFETCYAWLHSKTVIVYGGYQCSFDYLPGIVVIENEKELRKYLKTLGRKSAIHKKR